MVKKLDRAIEEAEDIHQRGLTVEDLTPAQRAAIQRGTAMAEGGVPGLDQALAGVAGVAGGAGGDAGLDFMRRVYQGGAPGTGVAELEQLMGRAGQGSGGMDYLRDAAGGKHLGGNPQMEAALAAGRRGATEAYGDAVGDIEGRLSMAGRFSGDPSRAERDMRGDAQGRLATALAENEAQVRYGDYARERGMQQQAGMALPGAFAQEIGTGTNAAEAAQGGALRKLNTELQAAGMAGDTERAGTAQQLQAAGMIPGLDAARYGGVDRAIGYGEQERANAERMANVDYEEMERYIGILGGLGGTPNMQAGAQTRANYKSNGQQTAQTALAVAGTVLPLMLSDERLKRDKRKIGELPVYEWNYKGEPEGAPRHRGPMAQDMRKVMPDKVRRMPGGFLGMDRTPFG